MALSCRDERTNSVNQHYATKDCHWLLSLQTSVHIFVHVCGPAALSHLSDLLTHQREQPDVKQHLPGRGRGLEVDHKHHSKQEEEGEVRHDIPVKLHLRSAVQAHQSGPAAQSLQAPQAGWVTVDRKVNGVQYNLMFSCLTGYSLVEFGTLISCCLLTDLLVTSELKRGIYCQCIKIQLSTYRPREFVRSVLPVSFSTVLISSFFSVSLWMTSSRLGRIIIH